MTSLYIVLVFIGTIFLCSLGTQTQANPLSKSEANVCVKAGMQAFLTGGNFMNMIDFPVLMARSQIAPSEIERAKALIKKRTLENRRTYRLRHNPYPVVSTQKSNLYPDYTIADGRIKVTEKIFDRNGEATGKWKDVTYNFTVWVKRENGHCLFAVVAFEEVWRLGSWLQDNL